MLMSLRVTEMDGVVFDLGASSRQFDESGRGFSFQREGPLDMRMSRETTLTARDILRTTGFDELAKIFRVYGEEPRRRGGCPCHCR